MPLRCLIVDDNQHFLRAARSLLEREGIAVVGIATTIEEALSLSHSLRPDAILIDIVLGDESGFDLARRLDEQGFSTRSSVILISTHSESDFSDLIEKSPAQGFLSKAELSAAAIRGFLDGASR